MVRKRKIEPVYNDVEDEVEIKNEVEEPIVEKVEEAIVENIKEEEEIEIQEAEIVKQKEPIKHKTKGITMPITKNNIEQVQCSSCKKYMSEKNLRYSHPTYCLERYTIDTPTEIPIPNIKVKKDEGIQKQNYITS